MLCSEEHAANLRSFFQSPAVSMKKVAEKLEITEKMFIFATSECFSDAAAVAGREAKAIPDAAIRGE